MKKIISFIKNICFHKWEYEELSVGSIRRGVISRRCCTKCGKRQIKKLGIESWMEICKKGDEK